MIATTRVGDVGRRSRWQRDRAPGARQRSLFVATSLTPIMLLLMAFSILPIVGVIVFSLFRYSFQFPDHRFRGLFYFQELIADPLFWTGLKATFLYVAIAVPLNIVLSLPIALGLARLTRLRGLLRSFYFLPVVMSQVAVALIAISLYDPSTGLVNAILSALHLPAGHWLGDPSTALPAIVVVAVWNDLGYNIVIFLAGLQSIPHDYYEAARIDGAGPLASFRYITLPLLKRTSSFILILTMISYFQVFTLPQVMTGGGPEDSTQVLSLYIYNIAIGTATPRLSQAMAAAVVMLGIILVVTLVQLRLARVEWDY